MDNKKAILNIVISTLSRLVVLIFSLVTRSILIKGLGEEANGIFSLYTSVIGILAVADLGIGTAITFSMYKPIVDQDANKISGLYYLYRKVYFIIMAVVLVIGFILTPFVHLFASGQTNTFNINYNFFIFLLATSLTYIYAHKGSLITAYKDTYFVTLIRSIGLVIESVLQILSITVYKSFELFIASILISNLIQWLLTEILYKRRYSNYINHEKALNKDVKKDVFDKSRAMFYHKLGTVLVSTLSNLIISAAISVIVLGRFTNYLMIMTGMISMISLVFSSITSVIGHTFAKDKELFYENFKTIYVLNIIVGLIFFLGYYAVINELVGIVFGPEYILDKLTVMLLTVSYFIQFMRNTTLTFRDASGTFYHDRYKPLIEGVVSLGLSLILVKFYGVTGILVSNIVTNVFICHIIEPYVLYKYAFKKKMKSYFVVNNLVMILFVGIIYGFSLLDGVFDYSNFINLLIKGFTSVVISLIALTICYLVSPTFKNSIKKIIKIKTDNL